MLLLIDALLIDVVISIFELKKVFRLFWKILDPHMTHVSFIMTNVICAELHLNISRGHSIQHST